MPESRGARGAGGGAGRGRLARWWASLRWVFQGGELEAYRPMRGAARNPLLDPLVCYHGFCVSVVLLTLFGIVMVYSSSSVRLIAYSLNPFATARTQLVAALGGAVIAAAIAVPVPRLHDFLCWSIIILSVVLQPLLIPFGTEVNGNRGWLNALPGPLGALSIQPAELLKLSLCLVMPVAVLSARRAVATGRYAASRHARPRLRDRVGEWLLPWLPSFVVMCVALGLMLFSKDMGTGLVLAAIAVGIQFVGGIDWRALASEFCLAALAVVVLVQRNPSRLSRIRTLGKCSSSIGNPPDECYQVTHGIYALNSGGLTGAGLGNSYEKWQYLPESDNDFIFAIIGEEMGFVGALVVILLYLIMAWCLIVLALRSPRFTSRLTIMGVFFWLVTQMLVNIGVTLDIMPVIGLTLPFLSAGGSSMLSCMCAAGLVVHAARENPQVAAATGGDFWDARARRRREKQEARQGRGTRTTTNGRVAQ